MVPGLFTIPTFTQFIIPRLRQIFHVHDVQIRMILLEHFHKFMSLFAEHELRGPVLQQLLLGIKDTNDHLVAMTLRCLADLVPLLGASTVIGKNRTRLFADGRPQRMAADNNPLTRHWPEQRSITPVLEAVCAADGLLELCQQSFAGDVVVGAQHVMPVRLAPDGGEGDEVEVVHAVPDSGLAVVGSSRAAGHDEEEDQWSDWENDEEVGESTAVEEERAERHTEAAAAAAAPLAKAVGVNVVADHSLHELDIVVRRRASKGGGGDSEEVDFFKDMEPVIVTRELDVFAASETTEKQASRLAIQTVVVAHGEVGESAVDGGWGDSDWE